VAGPGAPGSPSPPGREAPGQDLGIPGTLDPGPRTPGTPLGLPKASEGLPRPLGRPGRLRRGLFYINPSRRGPAVPPGSPGGPETPRSVESLQAAAALERELVGLEQSSRIHAAIRCFYVVPPRVSHYPLQDPVRAPLAAQRRTTPPGKERGSPSDPLRGPTPPRGSPGGLERGSGTRLAGRRSGASREARETGPRGPPVPETPGGYRGGPPGVPRRHEAWSLSRPPRPSSVS